jgi:hypothetical protein
MNHLGAKLILQAYRPSGDDASDPFFREALEHVEHDPELKKWFANNIAWDANLRPRLETALPVPRDLRAKLLALQKLEPTIPWWRNWFKLAAGTAMIALVVLVCLLFTPQRGKSLESFRQTMTACSLQNHEHVTFEVNDLSKIQAWLQSNGATTNFDLPPGIQAVGVQGCKVIDWNNQKVTMICFFSKEKGEHLDLFIVNSPNGSLLPKARAPQFARENGLMTACWSKNDNVYLLTGENAQAVRDAINSI